MTDPMTNLRLTNISNDPPPNGTRKFLATLGRAVLIAVVMGGGAVWASAKVTEYRIAQLEDDMRGIQRNIQELTIEVRTLIMEVKRYHEPRGEIGSLDWGDSWCGEHVMIVIGDGEGRLIPGSAALNQPLHIRDERSVGMITWKDGG